jgi:hypothetical protein
MNSTFKVVTLRDIIDLVLSGKLNPDPISQRPTTSVSPKKSRGIISAISIGYGVGMITVRNIENDEEMQKVYPGVHYIVIDGGHRVRALVEFYTNKFSNDEKHFKDLSVKEQKDFLAIEIAMESIICTSVEAIHIFRTRNKTTDVNFMEMIMCDDQSQICREVRSRTKYYREYQNAVHPAFAVSRQQGGDWKPECFDSEMNPRRKWDEYVFIAILKAIGGGNVDAGQREIEELVAEEYKSKNKVSKRVFAIVDRFLSDVRDFRFSRGKKLNGADFAAFQLVWFGLYEQNSEFVINDMELFKTEFMNVYTKLTGTSDTSYNNKIVNIGDEDNQELVNLKEYVRTRSKNFSNSQDQRTCAKFFLNEMPKKTTQYGVLFRDNVRSLNTKQREEQLALQKYKCALDGEHLTLEESVWGHDVSWADGGKLWNGKVVRRGHNTAMGQLTLDEYRLILKLRKEKAVA